MKHHIPENIIEEIRARADIVEVVQESVLIKKSGKNYKGLCPFHPEKTPSFTVSPEKRIYYCFGCGAGGNAFKFLMETQNLSFAEAAAKLASRYGIAIPEPKWSPREREARTERETLLSLNALAAEYFASLLQNPDAGKTARAYIKARSIDDETVARYRMGWAPREWKGLLTHLASKKCPIELVEKAGLIKRKDDAREGDAHYDRFRGRIMFPFRDIQGNIIAFAGRVISDEDTPKYLNSPETPLYRKGNHLFGLHEAREAIRRDNRVLLMEGYFDQVRAYQHGIKNAVATCGTALTANQVSLLRNHANRAVLVFDADRAGQSATERGYDLLLEQGMEVRVLTLPEGHDPDSFISQFGRDAFLRKAEEAAPFMEYFIRKAIGSGDIKTVAGRLEVVNRVMPFLSKIKNSVERSELVKFCSEQTGVEDKALLAELKKNLGGRQTPEPVLESRPRAKQSLETYLVQLMLADATAARTVRELVPAEDYGEAPLRRVAEIFYGFIDRGQPIQIDRILDQTDEPEIRGLLTQIGLSPIHFDNVERAVTDCVGKLRKARLETKIKELKNQRREAQKAGLAEKSRELHNMVRQMENSARLG
ncbi:MAG: DNA primase [Nitrospinae bacterium]|nr:DNA primase [Nitrospinota bacterium]